MVKNVSIYTFKRGLVDKRKIHKLLGALMEELGIRITSLPINFVSVKEILQINNEYLRHNYPTDIITFEYSKEKNVIDGEIFISPELAAENASRYKVCFEEEVTRLIIHGILHLLGYNDTSEQEKIIMKREENRLLQSYKFLLLHKK